MGLLNSKVILQHSPPDLIPIKDESPLILVKYIRIAKNENCNVYFTEQFYVKNKK